MQTDEPSLLCSMTYMETSTSLAFIPENKPNGPRFRRSRSGERSRSKENCQNNDNPSFYVKNCHPLLHDHPAPDDPKAKRNNHHLRRSHNHSPSQHDPQALIRQCDELNQLLEKSHSYIIELESRIADLEEERKGEGRGEGRERARENRGNLARLRKQIAETRTVDKAPAEALEQQVKELQAQSLCLRGEVMALRETIRKQQEEGRLARTKREVQLQSTILELRKSLFQCEKREGELRMEVGRLRLRVSKQEDNQQQAKVQQLAYLRYRYEKMRRKFEDNKKLLEALQRRQESSRYLFGQEEEQREVSLSLSP